MGKDYAAELAWGTFGRLPAGRIREGQAVYASYQCGELRLGSIVLTLFADSLISSFPSR